MNIAKKVHGLKSPSVILMYVIICAGFRCLLLVIRQTLSESSVGIWIIKKSNICVNVYIYLNVHGYITKYYYV